MTVYEVLNKFYSEQARNSIKDILYISRNYEYYAMLLSAYLFSKNNNEGAIRYYQDEFPTFGMIYSRFNYATENDIQNIFHKNLIYDNNYFSAVERLYNETKKFTFDKEKDFSNLLSNDYIISIKALIKFVICIRNQFIHENNQAMNYFIPFLDEIFIYMINFCKNMTIDTSSEFLILNGTSIYCLNSITNTYFYKNIYYNSVQLNDYQKNVLSERKTKIEIPSKKSLLIGDIEFIIFSGGLISYKPSGIKNSIEDFVEPFAISKYPITYNQFLNFLEHDTEYFQKRKKNPLFLKDYFQFNNIQQKNVGDCAVYFVDWLDAVNYCNFLSKKYYKPKAYNDSFEYTHSKGIRLPSEAEWMFATTKMEYNPSEKKQTIICRENQKGLYHKTAKNIDLYINQYGMAGMLGNINEWTNTTTTVVQLKKFEKEQAIESCRKIIKGGSFATQKRLITVDYATDVPIENLHFIGFRIAFSI